MLTNKKKNIKNTFDNNSTLNSINNNPLQPFKKQHQPNKIYNNNIKIKNKKQKYYKTRLKLKNAFMKLEKYVVRVGDCNVNLYIGIKTHWNKYWKIIPGIPARYGVH